LDRLVVDVLADGRVSVSVQWAGMPAAEQVAEPTPWSSPLGEQDLEDLRYIRHLYC
jgi:hypothetical protein